MVLSQNKSTSYILCESIFKDCQQKFKSVYQKHDQFALATLDPWEVNESAVKESTVLNYGGGVSLVIDGESLERASCGFSSVGGTMNEKLSKKIFGIEKPTSFFATGVSVIVHPMNPNVPSFHANLRFLETDTGSWFGGGCDLTPYYLVDEDVVYFHEQLKLTCEEFNPGSYQEYKEYCDRYFYLPHRKERRGVGGIFFDYLNRNNEIGFEKCLDFIKKLSVLFPSIYDEIITRNIKKSWTEKQREFQLWRRGRYVEFNLLYDRGTAFGLETGGRVESILSSMPPLVKWKYNYKVEAGSEEERLLKVVSQSYL